jgi:nitrate reductase beta subunit
MRSFSRERTLGGEPDAAIAAAVGMEPAEIDHMFRLLAVAKYDERYVIPKTHRELGISPMARQGACGLDFAGGPGSCGELAKAKDPFGGEPLAVGTAGNVTFMDFRGNQE